MDTSNGFSENERMKAPDTFESLKQTIIEQHSGLSGQLKKIGRYATDQPQDVAINKQTIVRPTKYFMFVHLSKR